LVRDARVKGKKRNSDARDNFFLTSGVHRHSLPSKPARPFLMLPNPTR
jgi:hypothetical protein